MEAQPRLCIGKLSAMTRSLSVKTRKNKLPGRDLTAGTGFAAVNRVLHYACCFPSPRYRALPNINFFFLILISFAYFFKVVSLCHFVIIPFNVKIIHSFHTGG